VTIGYRKKLAAAAFLGIVLASAGWWGYRWNLNCQQEEEWAQYRPMKLEMVTYDYALPDKVEVDFVMYGQVLYVRQPVRFTPDGMFPGATVKVFGYEPKTRPWLKHRPNTAQRTPAIEVAEYQLTSDTAAVVFARQIAPCNLNEVYVDPAGVKYYERAEALPRGINIVAVLQWSDRVLVFNTADNIIGLQGVIASGYQVF